MIDLSPQSLVLIGTDTEVGKTHAACRLLSMWREQGVACLPFKPAASGCAIKGDRMISEDADRLLAAAGQSLEDEELYKHVSPCRFVPPLAPKVAADEAGVAIDPEKLRACYHYLNQKAEVIVVEGVGGALVPLAESFFAVDLPKLLDLPAVVVARIGLGTINHTLLTIEALQNRGARVLGVIYNNANGETTEADASNPGVIELLTGLPTLGILSHEPKR